MSPQKDRTSLVVQRLRFHAPNAGGLGLIPGGTRSCVCACVCACVCECVRACVLIARSCPTLCDPMNCIPPGSSIHGILQAKILEWVAIPFSRGCPPRDRICMKEEPLLSDPPEKLRSQMHN